MHEHSLHALKHRLDCGSWIWGTGHRSSHHNVVSACSEGFGRRCRPLLVVDGLTGLERYHLWHSTRAELLHRLGRDEEAAAAYSCALELAPSETERTFLESRLAASRV